MALCSVGDTFGRVKKHLSHFPRGVDFVDLLPPVRGIRPQVVVEGQAPGDEEDSDDAPVTESAIALTGAMQFLGTLQFLGAVLSSQVLCRSRPSPTRTIHSSSGRCGGPGAW